MCVCVCVSERKREGRECVCERERKRGREGGGERERKSHGTDNTCSRVWQWSGGSVWVVGVASQDSMPSGQD